MSQDFIRHAKVKIKNRHNYIISKTIHRLVINFDFDPLWDHIVLCRGGLAALGNDLARDGNIWNGDVGR